MHADMNFDKGVTTDGTTIVSLKYNGGILIGADSRSSNVRYHF